MRVQSVQWLVVNDDDDENDGEDDDDDDNAQINSKLRKKTDWTNYSKFIAFNIDF